MLRQTNHRLTLFFFFEANIVLLKKENCYKEISGTIISHLGRPNNNF